jgi:hypothetical protein
MGIFKTQALIIKFVNYFTVILRFLSKKHQPFYFLTSLVSFPNFEVKSTY